MSVSATYKVDQVVERGRKRRAGSTLAFPIAGEMTPWPQIVPLSIRPCFKKTCCPAMTSSAVKTTAPAGLTNFFGIGGAFSYAFTVSRISTAKPAAIVTRAAAFHHEDNDFFGICQRICHRSLSSTSYSFAETFDPFSQMVKLHLGTI